MMDDTEEICITPKKLKMSGEATVPVEPDTMKPRGRLVRACGAVPIPVDGQLSSPSTTSAPLRSCLRRQLAPGKLRPSRAVEQDSLAQPPEVVEVICDEWEEWHKGFRKHTKTAHSFRVVPDGFVNDWKLAQATAKYITIGLYMSSTSTDWLRTSGLWHGRDSSRSSICLPAPSHASGRSRSGRTSSSSTCGLGGCRGRKAFVALLKFGTTKSTSDEFQTKLSDVSKEESQPRLCTLRRTSSSIKHYAVNREKTVATWRSQPLFGTLGHPQSCTQRSLRRNRRRRPDRRLQRDLGLLHRRLDSGWSIPGPHWTW